VNDHTITSGLAALTKRFDPIPPPDANAPVFMLASAWRSGSTLTQRLLVSSNEILMWGEPYDHSSLIRRLAESMAPFDARWPPDPYIVDPDDPPSADRWIANAYPDPDYLVSAHRAFFDRLFADAAHEAGYHRWGLKGVRLDGEHARYLKLIYPDARFVFLHRNPYDAFLSYRLLHDVRTHSYWWYHRWPDDQVATATRFGEIWTKLTESFLEAVDVVGATVIAYEDLIRGHGVDQLEQATGIRVDRAILERRVGGTDQQRGEWDNVDRSLRSDELADLQAATGRLARRLGYVGPTMAS
jgi:hypothetical protein